MPDSLTETDHQFLDRAVALAMRGRGAVEPNPMVGCVLTKDGRVIGEGWHAKFGGPHAEPAALASSLTSPEGATAYVTLEPCCHINKKTPPCVPALIAAGIKRVVIGCQDPNPLVSGRGIAKLRESGVEVDEANDPRCLQLLAAFIANTTHRRPYITLKWAQSADAKVAGAGGKRTQITNRRSNRIIHELRARCDAILVGIGTVRADDPRLTARGVLSARPIVRIVLDSDLRLSIDSQLVRTLNEGRVQVFCSKEAAKYSGTRAVFAACGVEIHPVASDSPGRLNLPEIMEKLGGQGISHLLVEPGPTLAASIFNSGLWDCAWIFRSPMTIPDSTAPLAPALPYNSVKAAEQVIDNDILTEYLNPAAAYGGPFASADFELAIPKNTSGAGPIRPRPDDSPD